MIFYLQDLLILKSSEYPNGLFDYPFNQMIIVI